MVAQVADDLTGKGLLNFIRSVTGPKTQILVADEFKPWCAVREILPHSVINHYREYVNGPIHTNTIEGFSSLLKRTWFGSQHHYALGYTPLYVAEATWKYKHLRDRRPWDGFMASVFA